VVNEFDNRIRSVNHTSTNLIKYGERNNENRGVHEELFFSIALFLAPTDLVNLAQTCKLFVAAPLPPEAKKAKGKRRRYAPVKEWPTGDDASARQWSLIEEASRKRLSIPSGRVE
jgi:hypothetical protein